MKRPDADPEVASSIEPDSPLGEFVIEAIEAGSDAEGVIRSGKLAGKSLWGAIWILAMPVLLQQTMQAFVGMTDKLYAGQLPAGIRLPALDAIGIGSYVGWFIGICMAGVGIGGQAIIARAMGAGDLAQGHRALGQSVTLSVAWAVVVGVVLWTSAGPIAAACQLSSEATAYYMQYIQTLAYSMPLAGIMFVGALCLHGAGETMWPSLIAIAVNVVNVVMSWALSGVDLHFGDSVFVNPFSFDLHVRGIAIGTAIGYGVGAAATLWILRRGVKDLRLRRRDMAFDRLMLGRVVRVGIPNFMEGLSMWAVNMILLMVIGRIAISGGGGDGLQGAHIIAVQWEAFSFLPGYAIGIAAGALAGQYLGAGNARMAQKAILACAGIAAIVMGLFGVAFMTAGRALTVLISAEPIHLEHAPKLLFICGTVQVFFGVCMVIRQGLRGVGDTRWTFIITTFSSYAIRLPVAYLLGVTFGLGIEGIWIGLSGEFVIRACLFTARLMHGGWKNIVL